MSSTLTGRATFILNPNAYFPIAENDGFFDLGAPANGAVQRITQATLDHGVAIESVLAETLRVSAKN